MKLYFYISLMFVLSNCTSSNSKISHECIGSNDTLYINYHGNAELVHFKMFQGVDLILKKKSKNYFVGACPIKNIEDAYFSYDMVVYKLDSTGNYENLNYRNKTLGDDFFIWQGKNRKNTYFETKALKGSNISKDIESTYLGESRKLLIYYPEHFDKNVPIFYMTDGTIVDNYAKYIDTLISAGLIKPLILIGVHSSEDHRYEEYVEGDNDNTYFIKHRNFFFDEVLKPTEQELENWSGKRYLYGFSNGGAFCMYTGLNYPKLFEEVIAFSTADYISEFLRTIEFKFQKYPKFYMGAGQYEHSIFKDNVNFYPKMQSQNINVQFKTFISGHDHNVWRYEFLEYLLMELPAK